MVFGGHVSSFWGGFGHENNPKNKPLGATWEAPAAPEGTWKPSGSSWKAPGSSWEASGAPLEPLGATWEPVWSHLRTSESSRRRPGAPGGPCEVWCEYVQGAGRPKAGFFGKASWVSCPSREARCSRYGVLGPSWEARCSRFAIKNIQKSNFQNRFSSL